MSTDFLELVREAKALRGWTRADCADRLGVSPHTLRSWCRADDGGGRAAPAWATNGLRALVMREAVYEHRGSVEIVYRGRR